MQTCLRQRVRGGRQGNRALRREERAEGPPSPQRRNGTFPATRSALAVEAGRPSRSKGRLPLVCRLGRFPTRKAKAGNFKQRSQTLSRKMQNPASKGDIRVVFGSPFLQGKNGIFLRKMRFFRSVWYGFVCPILLYGAVLSGRGKRAAEAPCLGNEQKDLKSRTGRRIASGVVPRKGGY